MEQIPVNDILGKISPLQIKKDYKPDQVTVLVFMAINNPNNREYFSIINKIHMKYEQLTVNIIISNQQTDSYNEYGKQINCNVYQAQNQIIKDVLFSFSQQKLPFISIYSNLGDVIDGFVIDKTRLPNLELQLNELNDKEKQRKLKLSQVKPIEEKPKQITNLNDMSLRDSSQTYDNYMKNKKIQMFDDNSKNKDLTSFYSEAVQQTKRKQIKSSTIEVSQTKMSTANQKLSKIKLDNVVKELVNLRGSLFETNIKIIHYIHFECASSVVLLPKLHVIASNYKKTQLVLIISQHDTQLFNELNENYKFLQNTTVFIDQSKEIQKQFQIQQKHILLFNNKNVLIQSDIINNITGNNNRIIKMLEQNIQKCQNNSVIDVLDFMASQINSKKIVDLKDSFCEKDLQPQSNNYDFLFTIQVEFTPEHCSNHVVLFDGDTLKDGSTILRTYKPSNQRQTMFIIRVHKVRKNDFYNGFEDSYNKVRDNENYSRYSIWFNNEDSYEKRIEHLTFKLIKYVQSNKLQVCILRNNRELAAVSHPDDSEIKLYRSLYQTELQLKYLIQQTQVTKNQDEYDLLVQLKKDKKQNLMNLPTQEDTSQEYSISNINRNIFNLITGMSDTHYIYSYFIEQGTFADTCKINHQELNALISSDQIIPMKTKQPDSALAVENSLNNKTYISVFYGKDLSSNQTHVIYLQPENDQQAQYVIYIKRTDQQNSIEERVFNYLIPINLNVPLQDRKCKITMNYIATSQQVKLSAHNTSQIREIPEIPRSLINAFLTMYNNFPSYYAQDITQAETSDNKLIKSITYESEHQYYYYYEIEKSLVRNQYYEKTQLFQHSKEPVTLKLFPDNYSQKYIVIIIIREDNYITSLHQRLDINRIRYCIELDSSKADQDRVIEIQCSLNEASNQVQLSCNGIAPQQSTFSDNINHISGVETDHGCSLGYRRTLVNKKQVAVPQVE